MPTPKKSATTALSSLTMLGLLITTLPTPAAAAQQIFSDTFTRTSSTSWGSATTGQAYTTNYTTGYSVNGQEGRITVPKGQNKFAQATVTPTDIDATVQIGAPTRPTNATLYSFIRLREQTDGKHYEARVKILGNNTATVNIQYAGATYSSTSLTPDIQFATGVTTSTRINLRTQIFGTDVVTVKAKAWVVGTPEPTTWTSVATDSSATRVSTAGKLGIGFYASSGNSGNVVAAVDNFTASTYANSAPTASFTADTSTDRRVLFNAANSTDSDGTIANYAWNYGDGTTGTGVTSEHTYTTTGAKTVTLTVTDNNGATNISSKTVNVADTHAPSTPGNLAATLNTSGTTLTWNPSDDGSFGTGVAAYKVLRNGIQIGTTTTGIYLDTSAGTGTHSYTISAVDGAGNTSSASTAVTVIRRANPAALSNLALTGLSNTTVALGWTPGVDIDAIRVTRNGAALPASPLPGTTVGFNDTTVAPKTQYTYEFTTTNTSTTSSGSSLVHTSNPTTITATTNPNKPSALTVNATPATTSVALTWTPAADVSTYEVVRDGSVIATLPATTTSYTDAALPSKQTFSYTIRAGNVTGTTTSNTVNPTTLNAAPQAVANVTSSDLLATLTATSSTDSDGTIANYAWDFGDGATGTGATTTHAYATNGTKTAVLTVTDNDGATATSSVTFTVTDAHAPTTVTQAPVTLDSTGAKAQLSWSAANDGNGYGVGGYRIFDNNTLIATVGSGVLAWTSPTLTPGGHSFTVVAIDSSPATNASPASNTQPVTVEDFAGPVTNLTANSTTPTGATITWTPPGVAVSGVKVYGAPTGSPLVALTANLPGNTASYTASGLNANTAYTYRVDTFNSRGTTTGTPVTVTTKRVAPSVPVVSVSGTTPVSTVISWTPSTNTDSYNVYVGVNKVATVGSAVTSYTATGLTPATGYTVRVEAVGDATTTSTSIPVTTKRVAPSAPVLSTGTPTATTIMLTWTSATNTDSYNVYKDGAKIATVGSAVTSYSLTGLTPATGYTFTVEAVGDGATTSNTVNPTTKREAPSAPVLSTSGTTATSATLTWSSSTNTDSYNVYKDGAKIATVGSAVTSYTANALTPATGYTFTVEAVGDGATTSNTVNPTTKRVAPSVPVVSVSGTTPVSTVISWTPSTNTDSYNVYVGVNKVATVGSAVTSYTATGLTPATGYTVRVEAVGDATTTSTSIPVTTKRVAPSAPVLSTSGTTETSTLLSWTPSTNTDTYNVYVGDTQIATVGSAVTSYQVTGLTSTTPFTFTVEAVGDGATISNAATATTLTPNVAPVAAFTPSVSHLTATVNAAASADPDGTITSYAWNFGDGVTATGVNASHTYAAGGTYAVTLTVTDNKGATHTTTTPVAVVDPVYVDDNFNRPPVTNGLGTASTRGGAYLESGSSYSVNGSEALVNTPVGQTKIMRSSGKGLNVDATVAVAFPTRPTTGVIRTGLRVREQAPLGANYIAQVKLYDNGTAYLNWVANTATFTGAAVTTEVPFATDVTSTSKIRIRTQAVGTDPVVLRAKAWIDGTPEPAAWTTEYTDSSATRITTAGNIGVHFYNSGASSSAFVASVDDLRAVAYENSAPVSHATVATNDLLATFDGSTSTDSNGPVTSYMWDFGDGTTATGITVNKKYSTMGSKTATLTVTDNDGATHTSTLSFAVADTTAPATPGSVSALLDAPTAVATLTWSPADDGNGYGVSQYTVRDNGTVVATVAGSTTSWTSAALAPGSHMFTVSATDSAPVANASNVSAAATVMVEDFAQPVTNITTSAISSDSATVSWTAPSPAVSGVQVYGGVTGQPLTPLTGVLAGTATSHALTGLAANTNYTLRVDTSNSRGVSAGTPVSFTTKRVAPSAAVLTTGTPTENSVVLSWTPSTNTDSYTIYQAGAPLGTVSGTQTSYTVTGLTATTGYDFYVTAVGDSSTNSNTVTVTTKRPAPSAPVLSASGTTTTATTLTWTASTNADNYTVYRDGQAIATVTDATSYLATGLAPSTLHSFSVVANGDATTSSNTVPVTTLTPNVAPTAAFTSTATDLVATVDASTSTDSDGTIASYAWDFGDGTTGTGANPTHTYAAAGTYTVTLTVTDNNGATHTATGTLTVTAPVTNPAYVDDTFTRNSAATLGSSPVGGAYLDTGSAYAVDGSEARITGSAGATMFARQAVGATDLDLRATIGMPTLPAANVYTGVRIREQASGAAYLARIKMLTDGTASLSLGSIPTTYGTYTSLAGDVTIASGLTSASRINVRTQIVGTSPVTIRAKAWVRGTPEPATWTRTATDSSAARITTAGNAGTYYYAGAAYVGALDDFTVKAYENVAPVADATVTVAGTTATFNASASSDSDGTISNYAWNFGDGTTGTGVTTTHTYAAAGTYTVTLVVTDNNGATHTTTKTVTVTVAQVAPTASFTTAVATTGLVTLDATASSATSGSITGYDWNMGDNNAGTWISGTGAQRVYEYRTAGTYTATLTVTASNGLTHTATRTVVVAAVKPSATNTGVKDPRAIGSIVNGQVVVDPAYALPHVVTGNTYITTDNAVYDGYDFRGLVTIKAKNVTIRNSIIRGRAVSNGGGDAALYITTNLAANPVPDYSGFLIEDTTIVPQTPTNQQNGAHANQPGTFRRVNVYGTVDGLQIWGPGSINILNSYLHDFVHYPTGWNGNNPTHNDTIQVQGGNGHRIVGNNLSGATNAAVMVTEDVANTNDLWINNNWLDNGSCSINFGSNGAVVQTGLVVNNNRFGRNQTNANCAIIRNATWSPVSTTGNVWDDNGAPVSVTNG